MSWPRRGFVVRPAGARFPVPRGPVCLVSVAPVAMWGALRRGADRTHEPTPLDSSDR